ncbi:MAG: hypothetical protein ACO2PM_06400 [Pyrobaculum sp.]
MSAIKNLKRQRDWELLRSAGLKGSPSVDCTNRYRTWLDAYFSGWVEWEAAEAGLQLLHCGQILRGAEGARRAEA